MAVSYTTTYNLTKPEVGASEDAWGGLLNTNFDNIDNLLDGTTAITGIDINSGSIDGTVIGGATPAAGSFTTGQFGTSLNVDGTVTADGLSVSDPDVQVQFLATNTGGTSSIKQRARSSNGANAEATITVSGGGGETISSWDFKADTVNGSLTKVMSIDGNGDISFYEDTGSVPKFFWDSSAERLSIGSGGTTPNRTLDITASTPAIRLTDNTANDYAEVLAVDGDLILRSDHGNSHSGSIMQFSVDGSEAMRIDSSGNVGIGTSSTASSRMTIVGGALPSADNGGTNALQFAAGVTGRRASSNTVAFMGTYSNASSIEIGAGLNGSGLSMHGGTASANANSVLLYTSQAERMRIDASGNLLVGTTVVGSGDGVSLGAGGNRTFHRATTSTANQIKFANSNGIVGSIKTGGSSTSYVTSSDYRLKTDAQPMTGASARIQALNPVNFEWIADGTRVDGFLAHEAQEVVPEAVTGEKDAVDADGNPEYQGIDQSKLVPLLTAALQEALTEIADLKARVTALEG